MKTIGRHLIAEFYDCHRELLDQVEPIQQMMIDAAELIGATPVGECFHKFAPQGVSGTVVIAESHLSIHTWPQNGYVSVDIYTCGDLNPQPAFEFLGERLGASAGRTQEILRGLPSEIDALDRVFLPSDIQILSHQQPLKPLSADKPLGKSE